jgi:hypothetical protein
MSQSTQPTYHLRKFCQINPEVWQNHQQLSRPGQTAYKCLTDNKPATMATVRLASATPDQAKLEGMNNMTKFFKHQLFLAGLNNQAGNASCHLGHGPFWHLPTRKEVHFNHPPSALRKIGQSVHKNFKSVARSDEHF